MRSLPSLGHAERVEQSTCSHSIATWQMMGPEQVGEVAGLYPFHSRTSSAAVATTTRTITTYELRRQIMDVPTFRVARRGSRRLRPRRDRWYTSAGMG